MLPTVGNELGALDKVLETVCSRVSLSNGRNRGNAYISGHFLSVLEGHVAGAGWSMNGRTAP
jgi:hypothetical protein